MPADFQVKAAFLINFPKYVDWPANAFADTNSPIIVAVFGDENVANEVQNMIGSGRAIGGHPLLLKRIAKEDEINTGSRLAEVSERIPPIDSPSRKTWSVQDRSRS